MTSVEQRGIFYRHFDLPANFPVIGLLGSTWVAEHMSQFSLHFHNCLEIGFMYRGEAIYHLGEEEIPVRAPCITIAPPHAPHMMNAVEGVVCGWKWLYVDPVRLLSHVSPQLTAELGVYQYQLKGGDCVLSRADDPDLCDMIGLIIRLMERAEGEWQGAVRALFHAFFLTLLSGHPLTGAPTEHSDRYERILAPAISCITDEYMRELTVHDLAQRCHLSDTHFRRIFKKIYGWSPLDYIHTVRIERACTLLFNGDMSIAEIADSVGYATPSTFTRQFHRHYSMPPSQWRQRMFSEDNEMVSRYFRSLPPAAQKFFPKEYLQQLGKLNPFQDEAQQEEENV